MLTDPKEIGKDNAHLILNKLMQNIFNILNLKFSKYEYRVCLAMNIVVLI